MQKMDFEETDDVVIGQLDDLLEKTAEESCGANCKAAGVCENHNNLVALVRYLSKLTKAFFRQQQEIKRLLEDLRKGQEEIARLRRWLIGVVTVVGGAILTKFGESIFAGLAKAFGG